MPPPRGQPNPIEGPGDFTVTETVHNHTYAGIDPTQFDLKGKAVFITGGSKGIGRRTAISFARAGASKIAIGARSGLDEAQTAIKDAAKGANRTEPEVLQLQLDVLDAKSVSDAAAEIQKTFGRLDVVVNVAGVIGKMKLIAESDPDDWWKTWEVNVRGPFLVVRACLPLLLATQDGLKTFLTVSSVGAHLYTPSVSDYQAGKLAVFRITEFVAAEYSAQGVIAITTHPGNILNDIVGGEENIDPNLKFIFTETNDLPADTAVWLSAQRRDWLNGRYVNSTWDMLELQNKRDAIVSGNRLKVKLDVDF